MANPTTNPLSPATLRQQLCADLDFHGSDGRHSTHGWHPFPAKFPPQLPGYFIERLSKPGEVVFDPMFGSGTTILEAVRLGRNAIGCDIDPLARLIAKAKLSRIKPVPMLRLGRAVVSEARRSCALEQARLADALASRFTAKTRSFVDYWFRPTTQLELIALLEAIDACAPAETRQFLHMVLSSTIIAKSGGVSLARDLAHTRPHRVADKKSVCAFDEFAKRLKIVLASGSQPDFPREARILARSAESSGLPAESVDLVVTSPPYANNAIDYMRAHKFSLVWLGWKVEELANIRAHCLGHDAKAERDWPDLPTQCEGAIHRLGSVDKHKAAALRRYFGEMSAVLAEMRRVLKPGKAAIVVVGSSRLRGIDVETHKGLAAVATRAGFQLAHIGVRRLDRDKRMMPARWGNGGKTQIEQRMHEEHVIGLLK